jgi:hypothetical protein
MHIKEFLNGCDAISTVYILVHNIVSKKFVSPTLKNLVLQDHFVSRVIILQDILCGGILNSGDM